MDTIKVHKQARNVNKNKPLIIGVTETWADENKRDGNYKLDEYIMYRDDRVAGRGGWNNVIHINTPRAKRMSSIKKANKPDSI